MSPIVYLNCLSFLKQVFVFLGVNNYPLCLIFYVLISKSLSSSWRLLSDPSISPSGLQLSWPVAQLSAHIYSLSSCLLFSASIFLFYFLGYVLNFLFQLLYGLLNFYCHSLFSEWSLFWTCFLFLFFIFLLKQPVLILWILHYLSFL